MSVNSKPEPSYQKAAWKLIHKHTNTLTKVTVFKKLGLKLYHDKKQAGGRQKGGGLDKL